MTENRTIDCDVLIIGAGSAGCVLASRLSENPNINVLLAEAGPDYGPDENQEINNLYPLSYFNQHYLWPNSNARWSHGSAPIIFPLGRGVGGSSLVMGMWALRGFSADYDDWEEAGAKGWNWQTILSYFNRLENDLDYHDPLSSDPTIGPLPLRRQAEPSWPNFTRCIVAAARQKGLELIPDINRDFVDGVHRVPISATLSNRMSSARAYLTAAVRKRQNLLILPHAECQRLSLTDRIVTGAVLRHKHQTIDIKAPLTVLSAGAIGSPRILFRSGIGDAGVLKVASLAVRHHLPGVGKNLQNHAGVTLGVHLAERIPSTPSNKNAAFVAIRASSGLGPASDLYLSVLDRTNWNYFGGRVSAVNAVLHKPFSRGQIKLRRTSKGLEFLPEFNFLYDERDAPRLLKALALAASLVDSPAVRPLVQRTGIVRMSNLLRRLTERSAANSLIDSIASAAMPLMPAIEAKVIQQVLRSPHEEVLGNPNEDHTGELSKIVSGLFHPVGTCRMGAIDDPDAVVTPDGQVRGLSGLAVCDASIMPSIPRANTNLPAMMIGERMSDLIKPILPRQAAEISTKEEAAS